MSRHGIDRVVLDPSIEVCSGPWTARLVDLNSAGWKFEVELGDFGRDVRVAARNPHSGMVGMFRGPRDVFRYQVDHRVLYFPEEVILTNDVGMFREMHVPMMSDLIEAEAGKMISMQPVEFVIYKPYKDEESQDIIVTLDKVPMLLEEIRKAQEPAAQELLHRQRKREGLERFKQEAKILTFG
jgi:hypothetical protein